jgi:hypothetical protein
VDCGRLVGRGILVYRGMLVDRGRLVVILFSFKKTLISNMTNLSFYALYRLIQRVI